MCQQNHDYTLLPVWKWHLLAHVCQRWRQILFASPLRLNLQILCTGKTLVKKKLDIWPAFPISIEYHYFGKSKRPKGEDNIIAALILPDRVYSARLVITPLQLAKIASVMQQPFPVLTHLEILLWSIGTSRGTVPVLPAEFLGGSAPHLQQLSLYGIAYLALPILLLSTSRLISLTIRDIPSTGCISPKEMVEGLAALTKLKTLIIEFQSSTLRPDRTRLPPTSRVVLPALTDLTFQGTSEYLEILVTHIDSPQLDLISIVCFNKLVDIPPVAQLSKFLDRSLGPKLALFQHARVRFSCPYYYFAMYPHENPESWDYPTSAIISWNGIFQQVSNIAQVLGQFFAMLSNVVHLKLEADPEGRHRLEDTLDLEWHHFFQQFCSVKTLRVSQKLAWHVALALEGIATEMVAEALPSLDLVFLKGEPASCVEKFVYARELSGHPVTVIDSETEFNKRLQSYWTG